MSAAVPLRVERLRFAYDRSGEFLLSVDHLELHSGRVLAILGPNGAGKSTLLRAMAGLLACQAGTVDRPTDATVAMVFQRPVMLQGTVAYNVTVPLWGSGLPTGERAKRVEQALDRFGVLRLAKRSAIKLSGGEIRRVALAQAFVRDPDVLLLDEPFHDLDAGAQESLSLDLGHALAETGLALALVTHDLRQALLLSDDIAVLAQGRVVQHARREEVLNRPVSAEVARLVGMSNLFRARVVEVTDGLTRLEVTPDQAIRTDRAAASAEVLVGVRPERIKVDVGRGDTPVIGKGTVRRMLSDGLLVTLWIEWAGVELRTVGISNRGLGRQLQVGDVVSLAIRPEDVHLLPIA